MEIIGVILVIASVYWVYTDARELGLQLSIIFLWIFGVIFLPIVFLPLYVIWGRKIKRRPVPPLPVKTDDSSVEAAADDAAETIKCTMCASQVNEDLEICPHCGHTLQPVCKNCGEILDRQWRVCPYCQAPTDEK